MKNINISVYAQTGKTICKSINMYFDSVSASKRVSRLHWKLFIIVLYKTAFQWHILLFTIISEIISFLHNVIQITD